MSYLQRLMYLFSYVLWSIGQVEGPKSDPGFRLVVNSTWGQGFNSVSDSGVRPIRYSGLGLVCDSGYDQCLSRD